MPPSTSAARGGGLPARNSRETVLATSAPSRFKSITWARSVEKQPDAGITGFFSVTAPILTLISTIRSTIRAPPACRRPARRCRPCTIPFCRYFEGAHADVARTEAAGHHLLHRYLAWNIVRPAEPLHQLKEPVRAAGEKSIRASLHDQALQNPLDILDRAGAVGIEHAHHVAGFTEKAVGHHEIRIARGEDRGDADMRFARCLRNRPQRRDADAAAEYDDMTPGRLELKAHAERPDHVEFVALFQGRQAARAAPDAFVEKFDPRALAVDAVDALRTAEE